VNRIRMRERGGPKPVAPFHRERLRTGLQRELPPRGLRDARPIAAQIPSARADHFLRVR
jgi:hypothetical protein